MTIKLILASQSPRRSELLSQLGYQFDTCPADIDESVKLNEAPSDYVRRMADEKAHCISKQVTLAQGGYVVLGADTSVVLDNIILAKPINLNDCINMLSKLSGQKHQVITTISATNGFKITNVEVITEVAFKRLTTAEITAYWHTGEPQDKAGSYGIQGIGAQFVSHISGSYSAVVGLPLYETAQLLAEFSLPTALNTQN